MYTCLRCGYEWEARTVNPSRCPHCKSTRWNRKIIIDKCLRCGAEWMQRGDEPPKYCPVCHSSMWEFKKNTYTCPKCGRTRILRSNSRTTLCPYCDGYDDRKRRKKKRAVQSGICTITHIWSDGKGLTLNYLDNGNGMARLYDKGKFLGELNIESWCKSHGRKFILEDSHEPEMQDIFELAVKKILSSMPSQTSHTEDVALLRNVDILTAEILALRESGMGPAAISLKLGVPFSSVMDVLTDIPPVAHGSEIRINKTKAAKTASGTGKKQTASDPEMET